MTTGHHRRRRQAIKAEAGVHVRVRHGVVRDVYGYRAMREVNGRSRTWLGPWHQLEADADADIERARAELERVAADHGVELTDRPNPDIGMWRPT